MSFSFSATGKAGDVRTQVKAHDMPRAAKEALLWAIHDLKMANKPDQSVEARCSGHADVDGFMLTVGIKALVYTAVPTDLVPGHEGALIPVPAETAEVEDDSAG